jgi:CzcA family heavy metal efflux pump
MLLSNCAIRFRTAVFVLVAVLLFAGVKAYMDLPREGMPDITIPYVFVTAPYEGTAPAEIEQLVTIPLEKKLNDVDNVKELLSTSAENLSFVSIEFLAGENIDRARQRVKDKVDLARADLPKDLDEPTVDALNFSSDIPVYVFALSGAEPARLKSLAEALQDRLERIPGIRQVELGGVREREIRVEVDLTRLMAYRLPLSQVMGRLAQENRTVGAGNIEVAGDKFQVRLPGEFERAAEIRRIVVAEHQGRPVFLSDVAAVADTFKDAESLSRVNGEPSVSLNIKKRAGVNAVRLIREVERELSAFPLPPGARRTVVMDQSEYVASMLQELENSIASGFLLVMGVLLAFLGRRSSLFAALAIPLSMLLAFVVMSLQQSTLNMIVLFGLVMASGMLVDDAIVVVENTYRHFSLGRPREEAARIGAGEVAWPVITSTLTTIAAFAPLLLWPGIMGQFMGFLPYTLIVTLLASLFVALVVNPAICAAGMGAKPRPAHAAANHHPFLEAYERLLRAALRHRTAVLVLAFAFLVLSVAAYARFGRGVELFPDVEPRSAAVRVKFPQGTAIDRTDALLRRVEQQVRPHADVKFCLATTGSSGDLMSGGGARGTHVGQVHAEFRKLSERTTNTLDLVNLIRQQVGQVPGAEIVVARAEEGPPVGAPVSIEIGGDDFDVLADLAAAIRRRIVDIPGLVDLRDDIEDALPEIQFRVDRPRAALLGLDPDTIGAFLRMAIYGLPATRFRSAEDEYDITVRLPAGQRNDLALLERIFVPVPGRGSVPLSSVGTFHYTGGRGAITRKDQKRVVTVTGNDAGRGVDDLLADVRSRLADLPLPRGYRIGYTGKNKEMNESSAFLTEAFLIAVGLIAVILVLQFNSVLMPAIILFTVVLSLIGVMWGLLLTGTRFSIVMTGIGVISLAGIVVKNGILLIDFTLRRRREGASVTEAAVAAGRVRLRPVLLTAATAVLGLIPVALGWGLEVHEWPPRIVGGAESSAWWAPMAVAICFGLTLATILTLVLVPVMYSTVESLTAAVRRLFLGQQREEDALQQQEQP